MVTIVPTGVQFSFHDLFTDSTFIPPAVLPIHMVRDTFTLALSRARYAAIGGAIGAGVGGLFSRSAASSGAAIGALAGAFVGESRVTAQRRIDAWREKSQESVDGLRSSAD